MKALKCKSLAQFAYNYTINVLSKCSNIISHRSSIFEGRHIYHRSSKIDTSSFEGRHIDHRRSKAETSHRQPNIAHSDNSSLNIVHNGAPYIVIPKIPRGTYNIRRRYTRPYTYIRIRQQPHTCTSYVLYAYLYYVYALVGGAISICDPHTCAVLRVCANRSHAVFHRPVV